jgi:hypothetical protein
MIAITIAEISPKYPMPMSSRKPPSCLPLVTPMMAQMKVIYEMSLVVFVSQTEN